MSDKRWDTFLAMIPLAISVVKNMTTGDVAAELGILPKDFKYTTHFPQAVRKVAATLADEAIAEAILPKKIRYFTGSHSFVEHVEAHPDGRVIVLFKDGRTEKEFYTIAKLEEDVKNGTRREISYLSAPLADREKDEFTEAAMQLSKYAHAIIFLQPWPNSAELSHNLKNYEYWKSKFEDLLRKSKLREGT